MIAIVIAGIIGGLAFYAMLFTFAAKMNEDKQRRIMDEHQVRADLVQDMLQKNMSADEIERILVAWNGNRRAVRRLFRKNAFPVDANEISSQLSQKLGNKEKSPT